MSSVRPSPLGLLLLLTVYSLQLQSASAAESASETVTSVFDSAHGLNLSRVVLAVAALLVGPLLCVWGYRLFHTTAYALGFIGGAFAVKLKRPVLVIVSSFAGAYLVVMGIGYFAGDYPDFNDLTYYRTTDSDGDYSYDMPAAWWVYLTCTLVLFVLSVFLQFHKTSHDVDYHLDDSRAIAQRGQQ